jgi:hypothetical protein
MRESLPPNQHTLSSRQCRLLLSPGLLLTQQVWPPCLTLLASLLPARLALRSKKEAEVVSLKHQLAERDGKLKAARTDALEARMALQQKDVELKAAFAQLSEAVHERSVMRTQLAQVGAPLLRAAASLLPRALRPPRACSDAGMVSPRPGQGRCCQEPLWCDPPRPPDSPPHPPQTHAELAETRAELEQLADDILAIKMLMDDEELGLEPAAGADSAAANDASWGGYSAAAAPAGAAGDEALDILQSLAALSRQLVEDASEDDAILDSMTASWARPAAPEA